MQIARRQFLGLGASALVIPLLPRIARGAAYPSGPVRVLVGFPEGGPVDIAARLISPWLTERLGQPFEVVNEPGESGNIAAADVAKAAPDGATLLLCGPVNTINTTLFPDLAFDFSRDIAPVASISRVPLVIEVHPNVPVKNLNEFIRLAKARPGQLTVGYAGRGTPQHVGIELFKQLAGVDLKLVAYPGSAPALQDLLAGKVDAMFDPMPSSIKHIRAGALVPLAVTSPAPSPALPGVPAAGALVQGYQAGSWFGLAAPKGTPAEVIDTLNAAVNAALADAEIKARLDGMGATALPGTPAEFAAFIAEETARYRAVIRTANITPA